MGSALGSLLIGERVDDAAPLSLLEEVDRRFPLNAKRVVCPEDAASQRVRLRHVLADLRGKGLIVSGAEPAQHEAAPQVDIHASFRQEGSIRGHLRVIVRPFPDQDQDELILQTQAALQGQHFNCVASHWGGLLMLDFEDSLKEDPWRLDWMKLGCNRASAIIPLEDVMKWVGQSEVFCDMQLLEGWYESGLTVEESLPWVEMSEAAVRLNRYHNARDWINAGVEPEEVAQWMEISLSFSHYDNVKEWRNNLTLAEAKMWAAALDTNYNLRFETVERWIKTGVTKQHLNVIIDAKLGSHVSASLMAIAGDGASAEELKQWADLGETFNDRGRAHEWRNAGIDAAAAGTWWGMSQDLGLASFYIRGSEVAGGILQWIQAGKSPADAKDWIAASSSFWDYSQVQAWQNAGWTLDQVKPWMKTADLLISKPSQAQQLRTINGVQAWINLSERCRDPQIVFDLITSNVSIEDAQLILSKLVA